MITTIKLAELLHTKKFDQILNQERNLDLGIKPISQIFASAYLGKALTFLMKDDEQFNKYFDKSIKIRPDFYQAYAQVAHKLLISPKKVDLENSITYYKKCFELKPNLKDHELLVCLQLVLVN